MPNRAGSKRPRLVLELTRAAHAVTTHGDRVLLEELGITTAQLGALYYVSKHPGCKATDLAKELGSTKPAITGLLGRLSRDGLIERRESPEDQRAYELHLTSRAQDLIGRADPLRRKLATHLSKGFAAEEIAIVSRFLRTAAERLQDD